MNAGCQAQYITKGCSCLADPTNPDVTICAYVKVENGVVTPCDAGCCAPDCTSPNQMLQRFDIDFRPTYGGALPPDFGLLIKTSDQPTETIGTDIGPSPPPAQTRVWDILKVLMITLIVIFTIILAL